MLDNPNMRIINNTTLSKRYPMILIPGAMFCSTNPSLTLPQVLIHEVGHAIDIWLNGKNRLKLFQRDYGLNNSVFGYDAAMCEAHVYAISQVYVKQHELHDQFQFLNADALCSYFDCGDPFEKKSCYQGQIDSLMNKYSQINLQEVWSDICSMYLSIFPHHFSRLFSRL